MPRKNRSGLQKWNAHFAKIDKLKKEQEELEKKGKSKEAFIKKIQNPVTSWDDLR
jgi:hypothetical protein